MELLASNRYYGVQQRFTRAADLGAKSAEETFAKWQGHEPVLGDMVRVIRTFRPDVIVSRFQGTAADGHGHHEAAGILTREAFQAAADPKRFPEHIREGLLPWQAKKLYIDNVRPPAEHTLALDTGAESTTAQSLRVSPWRVCATSSRKARVLGNCPPARISAISGWWSRCYPTSKQAARKKISLMESIPACPRWRRG